ncbi:MAG: hypothetical protein KF746_13660 [Chitinophagaceae bacterium]|nr:hypothetical protein [Chitinophagaceae bacterium]
MATAYKRNIYRIFTSVLFDRIITQGVFLLLPLLIIKTGVPKSGNATFMSIIFVAVFCGSAITKNTFSYGSSISGFIIKCSIVMSLLLFLMGAATSYYQLLFITASLWFLSGLVQNYLNIFMVYLSKSEKIGVNLGILNIMAQIGTVVGCLLVGSFIKSFGWEPDVSCICLIDDPYQIPAYRIRAGETAKTSFLRKSNLF